MKKHILLVDDEEHILRLLDYHLKKKVMRQILLRMVGQR